MRHDVGRIIVISPGGVRVVASNECDAAFRFVVSGYSARENVTA